MGVRSQRKGRRGEFELVRALREYGFDVTAAEPLNFGTVPDVYGLRGIHVECKRTERLSMNSALQQAIRDAAKFGDGLPAVFHRRNRQAWNVTMRLSDWLELYRKANQQAAEPQKGN